MESKVLTSQDSKRRILVVDDEPDITFTLQAGLDVAGFNDPELALPIIKPRMI
jgi:hypothetical protein